MADDPKTVTAQDLRDQARLVIMEALQHEPEVGAVPNARTLLAMDVLRLLMMFNRDGEEA